MLKSRRVQFQPVEIESGEPLQVHQSELLSMLPGIRHGLTMRRRDLGPGEANVSYTAPRDQDSAWARRKEWCTSIGVDAGSLTVPHQVHGCDVAVLTHDHRGRGAAPGSTLAGQFDAVVTSAPGVTLMTTHADCLPILMYSPDARVIASVHAGWRSTVQGVATRTIETMIEHFSVDPAGICAYFGPAICRDCYEVGDDVASAWKRLDSGSGTGVLRPVGDRWRFDLVAANAQLMRERGVQLDSMERSGICTRCQGDSWFSHRGQGPLTGRFGAMISLDT
ncbi:hypothetical protein BH23CHL5_BH23CHL5_03510 [soil metagenome]